MAASGWVFAIRPTTRGAPDDEHIEHHMMPTAINSKATANRGYILPMIYRPAAMWREYNREYDNDPEGGIEAVGEELCQQSG